MDPAGKAHAFVDDLDAPELTADDRHHLERVLRLRAGDEMTVADGVGRWRRCRFGASIEPGGPIEFDAPAGPPITIAFALVKGERPELAVQKLTEIGVDRIVPFVADRSVVRWDDAKTVRQHERLVAVAREAAMQSRRSFLPEIDRLVRFEDLAATAPVALADRDGKPPSLDHPTVLVGPEGGWSDRERDAVNAHIRLGSTVLRAETAAIVAGAMLCGLRSALFESNPRHGG